ncbi:hypothetical protein NCAST_25_04010 [Nocardia asteroides NBRC 15531]|uniref:Peptidase n=2 Tax=Nocardia asteroides TaxID=1824 RepID=U5EEY8_NOCAS|nr:hypothetical protein NCAST_25_04010 [Nocardia asteroides NBRC 15531]
MCQMGFGLFLRYTGTSPRAHREAIMTTQGPIGITPFQARGHLQGFVVSGRWPDTTKEWAQVLVLAVRVASMPGLLTTSTVFGVREELPDDPEPGTVGLVLAEGPVLGAEAIEPGRFAAHVPPALLMLHPPSETRPSLPECVGAASGCVLLPGVPHLGLEHRAAWAEAELDGTVTSLVSRVGMDLISDPDTAVLAMLLAA